MKPFATLAPMLAPLLAALLLGGCVTRYAVDDTGPTAKVRFRSDVDVPAYFDHAELGACPSRVIARRVAFLPAAALSGGERSTLTMLGGSDRPEKWVAERQITAGKPVLMHVGSERISTPGVPGYRCALGIAFVPQPDAQYEIEFRLAADRCTVNVNRLSLYAPTLTVARTPEPTLRRLRAAGEIALCDPPAAEALRSLAPASGG